MGCVYLARNKLNGKCYVGKTIMILKKRINKHISDSKKKDNYFHNSICKYGKDNFEWSILYTSDDDILLCENEKNFIQLMNTKNPNGYNLTDGGDGLAGYNHSDGAKYKISISHIGHTYNRGKKHSEETKEKIRIAHLGIPKSEEHKQKLRIVKLGVKLSDEHKRKIGESGIGRKQSAETISKRIASIKNNRLNELNDSFEDVLIYA